MNNNKKNIYTTQPFLPPLEEFIPYLEEIWDNKWLTNNGLLHQRLEKELCDYLGVKYISLFSNGTLALIAALNVLEVKGEVITTPYTFVATSHSILWNNNKPVFVDIDPETFNLDPEKIEEAITSKTTAIMPVHVYGNPCNVKEIDKIAKKHNLKVIYDACHAFGVKINDDSVLNYGDASVLSFHATKVFNTFEGGAVVCHDKETKVKLDSFKNFGFIKGSVVPRVESLGINSKMNEVSSAMGLLQLRTVDDNIKKRKEIVDIYRCGLSKLKNIDFLQDIPGVFHNYSYFPVFVKDEKTRDGICSELESQLFFPRKYFYPLVSDFGFYKKNGSSEKDFKVAKDISRSVLCLPLHSSIEVSTAEEVVSLILNFYEKEHKRIQE